MPYSGSLAPLGYRLSPIKVKVARARLFYRAAHVERGVQGTFDDLIAIPDTLRRTFPMICKKSEIVDLIVLTSINVIGDEPGAGTMCVWWSTSRNIKIDSGASRMRLRC
jgi:hypothetical protein